MLYERWRKIAQQFGDDIALHDVASGQRYSFSQLAAIAENSETPTGVVFAQGLSVDFVISVLRAWRRNGIVCPLEVGQDRPILDISALPPEISHLKMTSATTGRARVIAFTAEQLAADAENIVATMGLRREWPNLGMISLAHSYGFSNLILPLLLHGIPLVLVPAPLPQMVRSVIDQIGNVTLAGVPALWRTWNETGVLSANVRLAISAGAALPLPLEIEVFQKNGIKIHNFYGSSECGGIAYDTSETPRDDSNFVGAPMKNVSLSVRENGCLTVCSKAVGETYWPETAPTLRNGRFETSDFAELTHGLVYLMGRASDQINVAGRKVSPESIESVLLTHPAVADCLVFGAPSADAERAEKIIACVVSKNGSQPEDLRQFLLSQLPAWQVPREWWFVDSLKTNQRGKRSRSEWRQKFLAR